jgi:hypothetical protein
MSKIKGTVIFSSLSGSFNTTGGKILIKASRLLMFGLLSLSYANSALASDLYPKAYDATYETKTKYGTMQMHTLSNGKGQMRTETSQAGGAKTVTIVDMPNHLSYLVMEAQKKIMKSPLKGNLGKAMDEAEAKRLNATDLGTKMVNGHMSQGWSYQAPPTTSEVWIDKDSKVMVKSMSTTKGVTSETNIKTLNTTTVPAEANFKVPAVGYSTMAF